ncbi:cytochrome c peroxidase [uncultured Desulfobacter sp.]|uniref:cytochrome c peroxidase n=1 Tax=uncultured Desulfobacter sp. TaxID=240139 RepID=UPI0029C6091A|nr:cytochrome c peroxidase [uncultured Desulfobacter sp.]
MQKKLIAVIFLVTGLSVLMFFGMGSDLTSQTADNLTAKVQKADMPQKAAVLRTIKAVPGTPDGVLLMQAHALFGKLPSTMPGSEKDTPSMIALGKKLYFEKNISINKTQSCNSCHPIDNKGAGADNLKTGKGAEGKFGDRNDPSTMNAGFQIAQFWDGRAATLENQAQGPPLNPIEMGMPNAEAVAERLKSIKNYPSDFKKAFPGEKDPVTFDNFSKAVAAFERTLITHGRLDRFMDGDKQALTGQEMEGMRTFINVGCVQCHSGPNLGGMTFQKMGVFHKYTNDEDTGRFKVTNLESDKYVFKVPMLRNVTLTAPYFHDGGAGSLAEAVDQMGYLQLDKKLNDAEINNTLRFLTTLADAERTTAPPIKVKASSTAWAAPLMKDLPQGDDGDLIRYGALLLTDTYSQLGAGVKDEKMRFSGNTLNCTSCHQDNGTKQFGLPWMGVSQMYPQYRGREDKVAGLEERINGCFERSMNGKAIALDSRGMKAMVAYINWLSKDLSKDVYGLATPKFEGPNRKADVKKGEEVYNRFCMSCHGENGNGYQSMSAGDSGSYVAPALWGENSYNNGAGMNRLLTNAAFIHSNMPLGTVWNHPAIINEDTYDVAAYLSSQERPQMGGLEKDYPKLEKKALDCPYPPYADNFSQQQHQYGPFQPIKKASKNK